MPLTRCSLGLERHVRVTRVAPSVCIMIHSSLLSSLDFSAMAFFSTMHDKNRTANARLTEQHDRRRSLDSIRKTRTLDRINCTD